MQAQLDIALEWLLAQAEAAKRSKLRPQATTFEAGFASCLPSTAPSEELKVPSEALSPHSSASASFYLYPYPYPTAAPLP